MGLSSFCSRLTAENEHLTTAPVIEKMTNAAYRPWALTNTHSVQIILIICHLRIRGASLRCHCTNQQGRHNPQEEAEMWK